MNRFLNRLASVRLVAPRSFSTTPFNVKDIPMPSEDPALLGKHAKKASTEDVSEAPEDEGPFVSAIGEINGPKGPEPTRFGDYERNGRCSDF
jgi:hypothetical protein